MTSKVAFTTNPYTFTKIIVIPMVINKSNCLRTQFAFIIDRIISFIFNVSEINARLSNAVFSHIVSCSFSNIFSIIFNPFLVHFGMACFAIWEQSIRFLRMFGELIERKNFVASITFFLRLIFNCIKIFLSFIFARTFCRATSSFMSLGLRNHKGLIANGTNFRDLVVIPRMCHA